MAASPDHKYLFVHIMKTGGTSFADVIELNFPLESRYPAAVIQGESNPFRQMESYLHVPGIIAEVNANPGRYRMVAGHVPYAIRDLLREDYVTLTVLREPVSRTISYLKHCQRYHKEHMDLSLEDIYEDEWFHASFVSNYQTKLFSMSAEESTAEERYGNYEPPLPPRSELGNGDVLTPELIALGERGGGRFSMECFAASTGVISVDETRFEKACDNLRQTEVVGVTDEYEKFVRQLVDRYNWRVNDIPHRHAGGDGNISSELRRRIARDNEMDTQLYEFARSLAG